MWKRFDAMVRRKLSHRTLLLVGVALCAMSVAASGAGAGVVSKKPSKKTGIARATAPAPSGKRWAKAGTWKTDARGRAVHTGRQSRFGGSKRGHKQVGPGAETLRSEWAELRRKVDEESQSRLLFINPVTNPMGPDLWEEPPADGGADASNSAQSIIEFAKNYIGVPYHFGGTTPDGFDCSGFVRYVFGANGYELQRTSSAMSTEGAEVSISQLKPGDLLFFDTHRVNRGRISHVGMYIGDGLFIHAERGDRCIKIEQLFSQYYAQKFVVARRIM